MRTGRPRKTRTAPLPGVQRRAAELPRNAVVAPAAVDDPYEPGAKITALRSLRNDPLAWLLSRGRIDQAQLDAGRAWLKDYEIAVLGAMHTVDHRRAKVDGGRITDPFTDRQRDSALRLERDRAALGEMADALMRDVVGKGMTLQQAAAARGHTDERNVWFYGRMLREALELLARGRGMAG
jgi:hypothetical protein